MTTAAQRAAYTYSYVEPHPSVPKSQQRLSTGRGGAGNAARLHSSVTDGATATGPASRVSLIKATSSSSTPRHVTTGRGGAGNVKSRRQVMTAAADEMMAADGLELERGERLDRFDAIQAEGRVWHYGRGGRGNVLDQSQSRSREGSVASGGSSRRGSVVSSAASAGSRKGSLVGRVSNMLRRGSNESNN